MPGDSFGNTLCHMKQDQLRRVEAKNNGRSTKHSRQQQQQQQQQQQRRRKSILLCSLFRKSYITQLPQINCRCNALPVEPLSQLGAGRYVSP